MENKILLNDNLKIPALGFGTWQIIGEECTQAVINALKAGYRHIDTADAYTNHRQVGEGIRASGVKREAIFLTTKVWRDDLHHDDLQLAARRFLTELQTDYIDLLLVHWPNIEIPIRETLEAMRVLKTKE